MIFSNDHLKVIIAALIFRPSLWITALVTLYRYAPNEWWKIAPYLPVPPEAFWQFRMETAYGDPNAIPSKEDVISFLEWAKG